MWSILITLRESKPVLSIEMSKGRVRRKDFSSAIVRDRILAIDLSDGCDALRGHHTRARKGWIR
jgi:hypothetical protein